MSPVRTLSGLIGRRLSFSRRESSLNTLLEGQGCHSRSQSDLRDPVHERVQLGVTYEVSGDNEELGLHV